MRVLVVTDGWGQLSSATVGTALGRAWSQLDAQVAVVPVGVCGAGFSQAWADAHHARLEHVVVSGSALVGDEVVGDGGQTTPARAPSSRSSCAEADALSGNDIDVTVARAAGQVLIRPELPDLGQRRWNESSAVLANVVDGLTSPDEHIVLELGQVPWRDGGRGAVEAGDSWLERTTLVVNSRAAETQLTGLRGVVSTEGRAELMDADEMLRRDRELCEWAGELTDDDSSGQTPGAGAAGGLGMAVMARGGRVCTGTALLMEHAHAAATMDAADLVVTGCTELNFGTMGGEVVTTVTQLAAGHMVPVIVVAGSVTASSRELRQTGIEDAQALFEGEVLDPEAQLVAVDPQWITARTLPVARTWCW